MIFELIEDMNKALDADAYFAALSIALIIPDMCAKAEYGDDMGNKQRYIEWFDEYIGQYEVNPIPGNPYLSGEVMYQLRCSMLHQGTPNIDNEKIKEERNKVDRFIIEKSKKDTHCPAFIIRCGGMWPSNDFIINVRCLCNKIEWVSSKYYAENRAKFSFVRFHMVDMDEEISKMEECRRIDEELYEKLSALKYKQE